MLLKYTKCIYIVKIYLLRDKHLQKRQETTVAPGQCLELELFREGGRRRRS